MTGRTRPAPTARVDTQAAAARARAIVMEVERASASSPTDREFEKLGYDIESRVPGTGRLRFIEVKGRVTGADTVTVTKNEILYSASTSRRTSSSRWSSSSTTSAIASATCAARSSEAASRPDFNGASVDFPFADLLATSRRARADDHDAQEADRSRPAARGHQQGLGAGEVDPARASRARCTCGGRGGRWRRRGR